MGKEKGIAPPPLDLVDLSESHSAVVSNDNSIRALRSEILEFSSLIGQYDVEVARRDSNLDPAVEYRSAQISEVRKQELVFIAQKGNTADLRYRSAAQTDPGLKVPEEVEHGRLAVGRILIADTGSIIAILRKINPSFRLPPEDLMQVAFQAYQESLYKFDFDQGTRVITYGLNSVKWALHKYIRDTSRTIRIPDGNYSRLGQISRAISNSDKPNPSYLEIAQETGLLLTTVQRLISLPYATSLEGIMEENGSESLSIMADTSVDPVEELVLGRITDADQSQRIARILTSLSMREQQVITLLYGLGGGEVLSQAEISRQLDLSREGVRQIKNRAEAKLRALLDV